MMADNGLGRRLRQARGLANYTQEEIADVLGVVREMISYWERDRRVPSAVQLGRLAEAYGVTTGSLLGTEPSSLVAEEYELIFRGVRSQPAYTKAAIRRWLTFLDEWADLLAACDIHLPGRSVPSKWEWRSPAGIADTRLAPGLARDVRNYYKLGSDAISDLRAFLDREGVLVYRVALDPITDGQGVSGVTYNHPRLGACILVNTATTPGRQTFTLAHEFAHALFHYQTPGLVSRAGDHDRSERFADDFAAHFLVPSDTLREWVRRLPDSGVASAYDVIDLQQGFRVSYATMLNRLRAEGLLAPEQYQEYQGYSPSYLAAQRGLAVDDYAPSPRAEVLSLGSYPTSVLDRVSTLIKQQELSPAAAADLLRVPLEAINDDLLTKPVAANADELREFQELPLPRPVQREETTLTA